MQEDKSCRTVNLRNIEVCSENSMVPTECPGYSCRLPGIATGTANRIALAAPFGCVK
jgi:hypothetical protein